MSEEVQPIVSVVIPTHNRKALLAALLDSLLNQTLEFAKYEIIVVHNYTDDGTEAFVKDFAHKTSVKLSYFKKQYNGPAASRDFGARQAKGDYIAFIDDDCIATPDWLASAVAEFDANHRIGLVQGRTIPNPHQSRRLLEKTIDIQKPSIFFETCNIVYRKSVFIEVGGFSKDFIEKFYGEDTDLGWKVKLAGYECAFNGSALVYHEVFHVSYWRWLKEPLFFVNLPYLVGKVSPLREYMFKRYFVSKDTCLFHGVVIALILLPFLGALSLCLVVPYLLQRYFSAKHMPNPLLKLLRIIFGFPRALFMWWALVKGSILARQVLL